MISLHTIKNVSRKKEKVQRVGRGDGSNRGKTCCRGTKGDKSRSGYKRKAGYEGGQFPLHRRLPCRGFKNGRFKNNIESINLGALNNFFDDGDVVNMKSLLDKGIISKKVKNLKILSRGEITKKITIEADNFSSATVDKLKKGKVSFQKIVRNPVKRKVSFQKVVKK